MTKPTDGVVTIRYARASDAKTLTMLAGLDEAQPPRGPALVAEVDGHPQAALPLDGSPAIADPFRSTAELLALLKLRAAQLDGQARTGPAASIRAALRKRAARIEPAATSRD
jgi:hypothetical protein